MPASPYSTKSGASLARAVDALDKNTGEARRALYERARNALIAQLGSNQPVLVLADITKERLALEEAIRKVEAEAARNSRTENQALPSVARVRTRGADGRSVPRRRPTNTQELNPISDAVGDEPGPAALQELSGQVSGEAHANLEESSSNEDDIPRQRSQASAQESETAPVVLPALYTRSALQMQNDPTRRPQFSLPRPPALPSANWHRPLPRPLLVSGMVVATLNDARILIERHLREDTRAKDMWRYVSNELRRAALGGDMADFSSVLEMALSLEGLEWALQ